MTISKRSPSPRGFTLVELMVALTGGLFLSMMVFALSRDTSRFYQRENRLAAATLAGFSGFERLKADIARAGYLTTPNIVFDPRVALRPTAGWPAQLAGMGSLRITPNTPDLSGNTALTSVVPALTPDEIVLAGSYAVTDEFPVQQATATAVVLATGVGPMARLGYLNPGLAVAAQTQILANIFRPGRVLRHVDSTGLASFGVITGVTGGPQPTIALSGAPSLVVSGNGTGTSVNVVNFVRYQIRDLRADNLARFQPLFTQSAAAPGETLRTELVRQELDAAGTVIESVAGDARDRTTELVAEYAVDLGFSITSRLPPPSTDPVPIDMQPGDGNFGNIFAAVPANVGAPQRVRAVRVRLSVRSREADREVAIPGGLYRIRVQPGGAWARVRTYQADVALPNQLDVRW